MQAVIAVSRSIFHDLRNHLRSRLRHYLPGFLINHEKDFSQPLLSNAEIRDLQYRVNAKNTQPVHSYETAEQRMGEQPSLHRGYGLDYEESRPYQVGDDPRYMNWKLSARSSELYMKVFREERRPGVFILLDRRQTMRFGTRTRLKITQAARAASCIAFSAQRRHSSLSMLSLEADQINPTLIRDSDNQQAVANIIRTACAPCPPNHSTQKRHRATKSSDFEYALRILQETIIPGTTLYLIGDFMDLEEQHQAQLLQLSEHNNVHAIHIMDPAEKDLPQVGTLRFHTPEDEQDITINTADTITRKHYKDAATNYFTEKKRMLTRLNITYSAISTVCDAIETEIPGL